MFRSKSAFYEGNPSIITGTAYHTSGSTVHSELLYMNIDSSRVTDTINSLLQKTRMLVS